MTDILLSCLKVFGVLGLFGLTILIGIILYRPAAGFEALTHAIDWMFFYFPQRTLKNFYKAIRFILSPLYIAAKLAWVLFKLLLCVITLQPRVFFRTLKPYLLEEPKPFRNDRTQSSFTRSIYIPTAQRLRNFIIPISVVYCAGIVFYSNLSILRGSPSWIEETWCFFNTMVHIAYLLVVYWELILSKPVHKLHKQLFVFPTILLLAYTSYFMHSFVEKLLLSNFIQKPNTKFLWGFSGYDFAKASLFFLLSSYILFIVLYGCFTIREYYESKIARKKINSRVWLTLDVLVIALLTLSIYAQFSKGKYNTTKYIKSIRYEYLSMLKTLPNVAEMSLSQSAIDAVNSNPYQTQDISFHLAKRGKEIAVWITFLLWLIIYLHRIKVRYVNYESVYKNYIENIVVQRSDYFHNEHYSGITNQFIKSLDGYCNSWYKIDTGISVEDSEKIKILDFGSGCGSRLLQMIPWMFKNSNGDPCTYKDLEHKLQIVAFDPHTKWIQHVRNHFENAKYFHEIEDLKKEVRKGGVDLVIVSHALYTHDMVDNLKSVIDILPVGCKFVFRGHSPHNFLYSTSYMLHLRMFSERFSFLWHSQWLHYDVADITGLEKVDSSRSKAVVKNNPYSVLPEPDVVVKQTYTLDRVTIYQLCDLLRTYYHNAAIVDSVGDYLKDLYYRQEAEYMPCDDWIFVYKKKAPGPHFGRKNQIVNAFERMVTHYKK